MSILASPRRTVSGSRDVNEPALWQEAMRTAVRDAGELCRRLGLPRGLEIAAASAARRFGVFVPLGYLARMKPGDPHDPLLRQVLPLADEEADVPGYVADPLDEAEATLRPGLLQKYHGRALLVTTGLCAVHCRYCFRRNFPYDEVPKSPDDWAEALEAIAGDPGIDEVILSGGDPLTLADSRLAVLADRIAAIPHVRRLRIHSRLPIVIPERVCDELLGWLAGSRLTPIVVVHANHPAEIDTSVATALARLVDAGIVVLNQAVLLRGVNDDVETLAELCLRLVDLRVMPYYLHQLDRVAGAAHFEVARQRGVEIMRQLRARLPGYAVPRYVRETPGAPNKELLA